MILFRFIGLKVAHNNLKSYFSVAARFCRYASQIVGIEWELKGLEHWDNEQCYIVISNHQSSLDILGISKFKLRYY